jgi:hypothetical protein
MASRISLACGVCAEEAEDSEGGRLPDNVAKQQAKARLLPPSRQLRALWLQPLLAAVEANVEPVGLRLCRLSHRMAFQSRRSAMPARA